MLRLQELQDDLQGKMGIEEDTCGEQLADGLDLVEQDETLDVSGCLSLPAYGKFPEAPDSLHGMSMWKRSSRVICPLSLSLSLSLSLPPYHS